MTSEEGEREPPIDIENTGIFQSIDQLYAVFRHDRASWPIRESEVKLVHVYKYSQPAIVYVVLRTDLVMKFIKKDNHWLGERIVKLSCERVTEFILSTRRCTSNFALTQDGRVFHWIDADKPCPREIHVGDHFEGVRKLASLPEKPTYRSFIVHKRNGTLVFFNCKDGKLCDFQIYDELPPIKKLLSGRDFAIALSEPLDSLHGGASIYVYGTNAHGQLGSGTYSAYHPELIQVHEEEVLNSLKIVDIALGNQYTLMLTDQGDVYALGKDKHPRLVICTKLKQLHLGEEKAEAIRACKRLYSATIKGSDNPKRYAYWIGPSHQTIGFKETPHLSECPFFQKLWVANCYPHTLRMDDLPRGHVHPLGEQFLNCFLDNPKDSDVMLTTGNGHGDRYDRRQNRAQSLYVHSTILKMFNIYPEDLNATLLNEYGDNGDDGFSMRIYQVDDFESCALLMRFLYTNRLTNHNVPLALRPMIKLLPLMAKFNLTFMKIHIVTHLRQLLNESNFCIVFQLTTDYDLDETFRIYLINYAMDRFVDISQAECFEEMSEENRELFIKLMPKVIHPIDTTSDDASHAYFEGEEEEEDSDSNRLQLSDSDSDEYSWIDSYRSQHLSSPFL